MTTPDDPTMSHSSLDAVIAAYMLGVEAGQVPNRQELLDTYPEHADALHAFFADLDRMDRIGSPLRMADGPDETSELESNGPHARCRRSGISATTSFWKRSREAAWASSTRQSSRR